ncbi:MAG: hypothetical protein KJ015_36255 [Myxococcales bacterium]|nr:hypothetical protein [Myxococcales bacterium]
MALRRRRRDTVKAIVDDWMQMPTDRDDAASTTRRRVAALTCMLALALARPASAEGTIGKKVRDKTRTALPASSASTPSYRSPQPSARYRPAAQPSEEPRNLGPEPPWPESDSGDQDVALAVRGQPAQHPRLAPHEFELDLIGGGGIRGWSVQQYPAMTAKATTYTTWQLDLHANMGDVLRIHRGYYESNGLAAPRGEFAAAAESTGNVAAKAAWLLAMVGIPISEHWEPVLRYEARALESTAQPTQPVRIIPHKASQNDDPASFPLTTQPIHTTSSFETFVVGLQYNHDARQTGMLETPTSKYPPFYLGVGYIAYAKPYMLRVGDAYLDEFVFDARFRGAGLALGAGVPPSPERLYYDVAMQFGVGQVHLLQDLELSDALPEDWTIGYYQANAVVGYFGALTTGAPSLVAGATGSIGGASFFYSKKSDDKTDSTGSGSSTGAEQESPPLNWDVLWSLQLHAVLTL